MALRKIIIDLGQEFGLNKKIEIDSIHTYIDNQKIDVCYKTHWYTPDGELFKSVAGNYTLIDNPDIEDVPGRKYLTEWDAAVGDIIESGIRSYFQ